VVFAIEGFPERQRLVAKAGQAAEAGMVEHVDVHGGIAEGAERLPVVVVLRREVGIGGIAQFEQDLAHLFEPGPGGRVGHDVVVGGEPVPEVIARRH
jgi:hypothetical protein